MKLERWKQIDRIFQAALERAPEDRESFLNEECRDDPELRLEVESLLSSDEEAGDFIQSPAIEAAPELMATDRHAAYPGQVINNYRVISHIGSGGMGEVFLATDTRMGRKAALKLLGNFSADEGRLRRFQQEARAILALNHPHIITVYEIGESNQQHYIATEYIEGITLRQCLTNGQMSLIEALDVAIQIASALAAAHQAGIAHRDIKPENVMLRPDGYVKVLDFGLAKYTDRQIIEAASSEAPVVPSVHTEPGIVMGTASYMSPEQARGISVDERTDIFSLGVVLYEMIAGRMPFSGDTTSDIIAAILTSDPAPLSRYRQGVPTGLEQIVSKTLAKDCAQRYQTVNDLLSDLRWIKRHLDFAADQKQIIGDEKSVTSLFRIEKTGQIDNSRKTELHTYKRLRSKVMMITIIALLFASVVGAAAYFLSRKADDRIDSIAVLPFVNASGDSESEYLADGLAESLINSLSHLPRFRVVPRSTVFRYKGQQIEPQEIGRRLGVRAVLIGRVAQRGDSLNIQADLIEVDRVSQLWGDQYTRNLADMQSVQEEIAKEIAKQLRLRLSGEEEDRLSRQDTANSEAYQSYLKGLYFSRQYTAAGHWKAFESFNQAVRLDPNFARAYAAIAKIYAEVSSYGMPPNEAMPKAKEAVLNALALDESLAEAHASLALVKFWSDWDFIAAEREFRRALELNPNQPDTHGDYSLFLVRMGRTAEAVAEASRAIALDPISPSNIRYLALAYYFSRQYDLAIEQARRALDLDPSYDRARYVLGIAYLEKGMHREALAELERASNLPPGDQAGMLGYGYAVMGRKREALAVVKQQEKLSRQIYVSPYLIARIYAGLGEKEQAFKWLEKGYEERSDHLIRLKTDPTFDSLHSDARFADLMRRVGMS